MTPSVAFRGWPSSWKIPAKLRCFGLHLSLSPLFWQDHHHLLCAHRYRQSSSLLKPLTPPKTSCPHKCRDGVQVCTMHANMPPSRDTPVAIFNLCVWCLPQSPPPFPSLPDKTPAIVMLVVAVVKGRPEHRCSSGLDAGVSSRGLVGAVEHREELDILGVLPHVRALGLGSRERLGERQTGRQAGRGRGGGKRTRRTGRDTLKFEVSTDARRKSEEGRERGSARTGTPRCQGLRRCGNVQ